MRDSMQDDTAARLTLGTDLRIDGTVTGAAVDMATPGGAFRTAMLLVIAGEVTDGVHTVVLEESDTGASDWAAVAGRDRQGALTAVGPAQANSVQRQSYVGSKRFLRASVATTGATVGGTTTAVLLLSQGSGAPIT